MFAKQLGLKPVALAKSIQDNEENAKKTECTHTPSQRSHKGSDELQQQLHAQLEMKSRKRKHITLELDTDKPQPTYTSKRTRRKGNVKLTQKRLDKIRAKHHARQLQQKYKLKNTVLNMGARTFGSIPWEDLPDYTVNFKTHPESKAFLKRLRKDNRPVAVHVR
mgnify:CR=1 FL=1|tara:strand:- start:286 stop:777 length:492 start_codon:yes stop_codon:yes gene_type:complete